jgi:hypothetical protein
LQRAFLAQVKSGNWWWLFSQGGAGSKAAERPHAVGGGYSRKWCRQYAVESLTFLACCRPYNSSWCYLVGEILLINFLNFDLGKFLRELLEIL